MSDEPIDLRDPQAPRAIDIDAREQYAAFLETSKQFLGVPGGGVKVLAALIELFDTLLAKAPPETQETFWALVEDKMTRARAPFSTIIDPTRIN